MTKEQRDKNLVALRALCDETGDSKQIDYASPDDCLANFKQMAEFTGVTKYQAWLIYCAKHVTAIFNAIKANPDFPAPASEPIKMRIVDVTVYMHLLDCLIEEDITNNKPKVGRPRKIQDDQTNHANSSSSPVEITQL